MSHTLGQLQADDIGLTVTVKDLHGTLDSVRHHTGAPGETFTQVWISHGALYARTYPSWTPCAINPAPAPEETP